MKPHQNLQWTPLLKYVNQVTPSRYGNYICHDVWFKCAGRRPMLCLHLQPQRARRAHSKWPSLILAREDRKATALIRQQGYSTVLQDMRRKHRRHSVSVPCSRTFRSFGGISKMSEIKLWSKYVKVILPSILKQFNTFLFSLEVKHFIFLNNCSTSSFVHSTPHSHCIPYRIKADSPRRMRLLDV